MRHVTDGELHAYLDGALDLLPEGRGGEVREHLASCPVCQERLQDEERIRAKAQGILEASAPPQVEVPPFEEIRERAEAAEAPPAPDGKVPGRHRGPLQGLPLAWAATVVLALGVGWMGGEIWRTLPQDEQVFSGVPSAAEPAGSRLDESEEVGETGAEPPSPSSPRQGVSGPDASGVAGAGGAQLDPPPSESPAPALESETAPSESDSENKGRTSMDQGAVALERILQPRASVATDPALLDVEGISPDNSLALPGLEVLSVEWEEWIPGERNLHIRQLLPMGDTLELRYLGMLMGTDPNSAPAMEPAVQPRSRGDAVFEHPPLPKVMEASLPPGWNQVVMRRGRGWLVARAPLDVEQLRALLRSLR